MSEQANQQQTQQQAPPVQQVAPPVQAPVAPPVQQAQQPGPVPYDQFAQLNHRFRSMEQENATLKQQLAQVGQQTQTQVQTEVARVRAESTVREQLALAGMTSAEARTYFTQRYQALGQQAPAPEQWVSSLKTSEPMFFGGVQPTAAPPPAQAPAQPAAGNVATPPAQPAPAPSPVQPPAPAPRAVGNPDAGTGATPPATTTTDPPLTNELIDKMDLATYTRRRPEIMAFLKQQRGR